MQHTFFFRCKRVKTLLKIMISELQTYTKFENLNKFHGTKKKRKKKIKWESNQLYN